MRSIGFARNIFRVFGFGLILINQCATAVFADDAPARNLKIKILKQGDPQIEHELNYPKRGPFVIKNQSLLRKVWAKAPHLNFKKEIVVALDLPLEAYDFKVTPYYLSNIEAIKIGSKTVINAKTRMFSQSSAADPCGAADPSRQNNSPSYLPKVMLFSIPRVSKKIEFHVAFTPGNADEISPAPLVRQLLVGGIAGGIQIGATITEFGCVIRRDGSYSQLSPVALDDLALALQNLDFDDIRAHPRDHNSYFPDGISEIFELKRDGASVEISGEQFNLAPGLYPAMDLIRQLTGLRASNYQR